MNDASLASVEGLSDDEHVGGAPLLAVDSLSDAELVPASAEPSLGLGLQVVAAELSSSSTTSKRNRVVAAELSSPSAPDARKRASKRPFKDLDPGLRQQLFRLASSKCPCARGARFHFQPRASCYKPFLDRLDELVRLRMKLARLDKQDADNEVSALRYLLPHLFWAVSVWFRANFWLSFPMHFLEFPNAIVFEVMNLLKMPGTGADTQFRLGQILLGNPVCQRSFRKLLGIGSNRYTKLKKAASEGLAMAPLDGRRAPRRGTHKHPQHASKRALVIEFLEELRNSISEPLPEANQDPKLALMRHPSLFRRHRGRRPRAAAQVSRGGDRSKMRLLPPGSFTDYLRLLQSRNPGVKISLKLFNSVSGSESWQH